MMNKWKIAYEVIRHSKYEYLSHDVNVNLVWLVNRQSQHVLGISDSVMSTGHIEAQILDQLQSFTSFVGFRPKEVKLVSHSPNDATTKSISNGITFIHQQTSKPERLICALFYRIDYTYKPDKEEAVYKKRVTSRIPFESHMMKFTPVTGILLSINIIVFLISYFNIQFNQSYLWPNLLSVSHYEVSIGEVYRLLTSSFLHVSIEHFLFNMFALYIIGKFVESLYGWIQLVVTYVITGTLSSLFSLMFITEGMMLGASGSIYGLLGLLIVYLVVNKKIDIKKIVQFAIIIGVLSLMTQFLANVNHYAHFSGLLYGIFLGIIFNVRKVNIRIVFLSIVLMVVMIVMSIVLMSSQVSVPAFDVMAEEYIEKGQYEEALAVINEGFRQNKESYQTYASLAYLAEVAGDFDRRDAYREKSFEMNPRNEQIAKEKIIQHRKHQEYDDIRQILLHFDKNTIQDDGLRLLKEEYDD